MSPSWTAPEIGGHVGLQSRALINMVTRAMRRSASTSFLTDEPARIAPSSVADATDGTR